MAFRDKILGGQINGHEMVAAFRGFNSGTISVAQIKSAWDIAATGQDNTDWNALANSYTAATNKDKWLHTIEAATILLQEGVPQFTGDNQTGIENFGVVDISTYFAMVQDGES